MCWIYVMCGGDLIGWSIDEWKRVISFLFWQHFLHISYKIYILKIISHVSINTSQANEAFLFYIFFRENFLMDL